MTVTSSHPVELFERNPPQGVASLSAKGPSAVDDQRARYCVPREIRQIEIQITIVRRKGKILDNTHEKTSWTNSGRNLGTTRSSKVSNRTEKLTRLSDMVSGESLKNKRNIYTAQTMTQ